MKNIFQYRSDYITVVFKTLQRFAAYRIKFILTNEALKALHNSPSFLCSPFAPISSGHTSVPSHCDSPCLKCGHVHFLAVPHLRGPAQTYLQVCSFQTSETTNHALLSAHTAPVFGYSSTVGLTITLLCAVVEHTRYFLGVPCFLPAPSTGLRLQRPQLREGGGGVERGTTPGDVTSEYQSCE